MKVVVAPGGFSCALTLSFHILLRVLIEFLLASLTAKIIGLALMLRLRCSISDLNTFSSQVIGRGILFYPIELGHAKVIFSNRLFSRLVAAQCVEQRNRRRFLPSLFIQPQLRPST